MNLEIEDALKELGVELLDPELDFDLFPENAEAAIAVDIVPERYVTDYKSHRRYGLRKAKVTFGVYLCTPYSRGDNSLREHVHSVINDITARHPGKVYKMYGFTFEHGFCLGVLLC